MLYDNLQSKGRDEMGKQTRKGRVVRERKEMEGRNGEEEAEEGGRVLEAET